MDPDETAPIGAVCSGSQLFSSILNLSVMLGNYLQQTASTDNIFRCIFFLALEGFNTTCISSFHTFFMRHDMTNPFLGVMTRNLSSRLLKSFFICQNKTDYPQNLSAWIGAFPKVDHTLKRKSNWARGFLYDIFLHFRTSEICQRVYANIVDIGVNCDGYKASGKEATLFNFKNIQPSS